MTSRTRSTASSPVVSPWHALAVDDVLQRVDSSLQGLASEAVAARRAMYGRNELPVQQPLTLLTILLHQLLSPLIYILLAAATVSVLLDDWVDAGFILVVVALNAGLGTFQEWRAQRSASALQLMLKVQARVRRDDRDRRIAADELVPGDIVILESGNTVPADLRLLRVVHLAVDESFLTGESVPVQKQVAPVATDVMVNDRTCMAFAGATVSGGRAEGVVVATGLRTEVGRIAASVTATGTTKPPLVIRMERFARQISLAVLAVCGVLGTIALLQGIAARDVFFLVVALAVSAIPEGLPVAITVALSIATTRMARRSVIVRRLTAVEGLGSCTYIASDKTGTLTVNRQTVRRLVLPGAERFEVSGEAYDGVGAVTTTEGGTPAAVTLQRVDDLVRAGVLCNEATLQHDNGQWRHDGDAIDVALLALGHKRGISPAVARADRVVWAELPFESERRFAAVFFEHEGRHLVAMKGALETVLHHCRTMRTAQGDVAIDHARIEALGRTLLQDGYRVLAMAEGVLPEVPVTVTERDLPPLTMLGMVGFIDPARPEARTAIAQCQTAGITVAMVTGDHPLTAFSIARDLGMTDDESQVIAGAELDALGGPESPAFGRAVARGRVFARVSPMQKLQIVQTLRAQGHHVAVTGDGVNDAPALKAADISVAMGSGSDVTKDTASLIVTDDNFASIEAGVEEGRFAYANIRKVTYLLIATGAAEVTLFTLSLLAGLPLPLVAVQLLWLNLVTNGIQDVALAFEGGEPGTMRRPPRPPSEGIFNRLMIQQTVTAGLTMGVLVMINWVVLLDMGFTESEARNRVLLLMVLLQNFHVFNARSEHESAFKVPLNNNRVLVAGVLLAQGVHLLAMHVPLMQRVLHIAPVSAWEWAVPFMMASTIIMVMELFKWMRKRGAPHPVRI
jgi:magnesium-transporting ATPase (P-type)